MIEAIKKHFHQTCDLCSFEVKSLDCAIKHYYTEHNRDGYLKCCGLKFKRSDLLEDHIQSHLNNNNRFE